MRTNAQEAVLSAYIVSIGKRTPRDAAQDAAELCGLANSLNRLRVSGFVLTNPESKKARSPAMTASRSGKSGASKIYKPGSRPAGTCGLDPQPWTRRAGGCVQIFTSGFPQFASSSNL